MIQEQEHQKYYNDIRNKEKDELLQSEERFLILYKKRLAQNSSALLAAIVIIIGFTGLLATILYKLFGKMF